MFLDSEVMLTLRVSCLWQLQSAENKGVFLISTHFGFCPYKNDIYSNINDKKKIVVTKNNNKINSDILKLITSDSRY